jgi:hypothetical protein
MKPLKLITVGGIDGEYEILNLKCNIINSKLEGELIKRLMCLQFPFIYKKYQKNKELQNCYVSFSPMYVESGGLQVLCFEEEGEKPYYQVSCGKYTKDVIKDMENYLNDVLTDALGV